MNIFVTDFTDLSENSIQFTWLDLDIAHYHGK